LCNAQLHDPAPAVLGIPVKPTLLRLIAGYMVMVQSLALLVSSFDGRFGMLTSACWALSCVFQVSALSIVASKLAVG
jgi:hypothetical protein